MLAAGFGIAALGGLGAMAWAVRGKSSSLLAESVWRGPTGRRALALTFDDGPSESTPALLELLARHQAKATFFQCGCHARRLPEVARAVTAAGHELGNHTDTHAPLYLRRPAFIESEIARAQAAIVEASGARPRWFRPTYGARWFGLRAAQRKHSLTGVMWSCIARDWVLPPAGIVRRLRRATRPGAILCLHDGRQLEHRPDTSATLAAVAELLPWWEDEGYELVTVSELMSGSA